MKGYSANEVAHLLGLPVGRIYSYVRSGFLEPERDRNRLLRFTFQDLVVLRAAKGLLQAQISPTRVRRILKQLVDDLPEGRTLAGLTIVAEGNRIVARDGGEQWNPESGQRIFDFDVSELVRRVEPIVRRQALAARSSEGEMAAEEWYEMGMHLEVAAPDEARDAYRRVLELDPLHADAHVNLGRLLHEQGQLHEAEEHYRGALAADPDSITAAFNLGVVLEDLGRSDEAVFVYERLIKKDAGNADAHFNLARLYERSGKRIAALRHTKAYERLTVEH
jgi:tetratricopeptide (TPR) repeat protein